MVDAERSRVAADYPLDRILELFAVTPRGGGCPDIGDARLIGIIRVFVGG
jgi:hypothetical protein